MSLAVRIAAALLVPVALLMGLAAWQLSIIERLVEENRTILQATHAVDAATLALREDLGRAADHVEKSRLLDDPDYAAAAERAAERVSAGLEQLDALELTEEQRAGLATAELGWTEWRAAAADSPAPPPEELAPPMERTREGIDRLAAASRARGEEIVRRSQDDAARAARGSRAATLAAAGAAVGLALLLGGAIVSPVRRLARGAREIGAGRFGHRVEAAGPPELAALAEEFNRMAGRLDELDRLKEDFLAGVSHDLKAPLASMQETGRLLLEDLPGPLNPQQRRLVELSLASAERLSVMIGELLDLARLRSGAPLEPEPCDPADLARTAVRELAGLALERRIELRGRMPEAPMEVWWDGSRVIQLLENLLSNAIRHAPDGSTVDVVVEPAGDGVDLIVRDHGPGIDDDHKERVFDRFYRGEGRRSGSGLGLAIARSIVDAHGGGIRVEDPAGGGARFVAWLPSRAGS